VGLATAQFIFKANFLFWLVIKYLPSAMLRYTGVSAAVEARLAPDERQRVLRLLDTFFPISLRLDGILNDLRNLNQLGRLPLEDINAPTLILHTLNDPITPYANAQFSASTIRGARLITLTEGGHLGVGNPDVYREVVAFLKAHTQ
jgi:pimeloyl-ACP methyl ester carboxylesterase